MRKLHDIDKLARDGTHQPSPYAYDSSRWDAMQKRLDQGTGKRRIPAVWWIWTIAGALLLTGGLLLWNAVQQPASNEGLHARQASTYRFSSPLSQVSSLREIDQTGHTHPSSKHRESRLPIGDQNMEDADIPVPKQNQIADNLRGNEAPSDVRESASHSNEIARSNKHDEKPKVDHASDAHALFGNIPSAVETTGASAEGEIGEPNDLVAESKVPAITESGSPSGKVGFDMAEATDVGDPVDGAVKTENPMQAPGTEAGSLPVAAVPEANPIIYLTAMHALLYTSEQYIPALPVHDYHKELAQYKGSRQMWTVYLDFGNRILPSWTSGSLLLMNPHAGTGIGYRAGAHWQVSAGLRSYLRHGENLTHSVDHIKYSFGRNTERYTQHLQRLWYLEIPLGMEYLAGSRTWIGLGINPAWLLTTQSEISYSLADLPDAVNVEPGWHFMDGLRRFDASADLRFGFRITELTDLYILGQLGLRQVLSDMPNNTNN